MLNIREAVRRILLQNATVNTLVSGRIYPVVIPQAAIFPCISYRLRGEDEEPTHDDGSSGVVSTFEIICWGAQDNPDNAGAVALAEAVRLALIGFQGTVSDGAVPTPSTREIHIITKSDAEDGFNHVTRTHQVRLEFDVSAEADIP